MSCHGSNKKRIAIIAGAGAGVAGIAYVSLAANPVAAAALPVVLAFAACPAMCAGMWGAMWLGRRLKKRNSVMQAQVLHKNADELATKDHEVEGQSEESREIVQVQDQNQRKRKAKQDDSAESVTST